MPEQIQTTPSMEEIHQLLLEILAELDEIQKTLDSVESQDAADTFTD